METFALYLLKSAIWLTGFTLVYILFLRNERFFVLNRFFLISGILVSLFFPLIQIHYSIELPSAAVNPIDFTQTGTQVTTGVNEIITDKPFDFRLLLAGLYLIGVMVFAARLIWQAFRLYNSIKKATINNWGPARLIRTSEYLSSFSFFNYVFVNPSVSENEVEEIMNHELVHITQKHWFDLLLVEMVSLFQWVNPFVRIYIRFIKLNHEFIADEGALQRTSDPAIYRATLLNQMFSSPVFNLSNSFNYSLNKKRFDMMKKIITSPYRKLKVLLVVPVIAIVFYAFATPEYNYVAPVTDPLTIYQASVIIQTEVKGIVLKEDGKPLAGVGITSTGTIGNAGGATTGTDGRFSFINLLPDAYLSFRYAGYKQLTIKADFNKEMVVKMEIDPEYKPPVTGSGAGSFGTQRPQPIVAIDGVISEKNITDARKDLGYDMGIMTMLTGKAATDKYGEKGVNGVYEITTRKKALEMGLKPPFPRLAPQDYPTFQNQPSGNYSQWVASQAKYPAEAKAKNIEGWVGINFKVELDGTVTNIVSTIAVDKILSDEIIRVIQSGPKWDPPKNTNVDEPYTSSLTLKFKLPDQVLNEAPYVIVEQMPSYPGGDAMMMNFIMSNIKYPEEAKAKKIEGRVILRFAISTEGNVEAVSVLKGVNPQLDAEAVRVLSMLSGWKPGIQGGKAVYVWYSLPITFTLPASDPPK